MKLYKLSHVVLSVRGNAQQFLNGLTSNSLDKPHNAFLNQHGRIIATFDQIKISDDEFLICIAPMAKEALLNHASRYAKLNKTTIAEKNDGVYFDVDGDFPLENDWKIPQKKGRLIITQRQLPSDILEEEFNLFRLKNEIPLHGIDYPSDILILNVHEHEYVSYTKGCFLGQEPVAKVHNRSKPTWKLVVRYEDEVAQEERSKMTSLTQDPSSGRRLGFIFVANESR